jgi:hypothetical protein
VCVCVCVAACVVTRSWVDGVFSLRVRACMPVMRLRDRA